MGGAGEHTWERQDGVEITTTTRRVEGGLLEITEAAISDTGVYICRNGPHIQTITLQVLGRQRQNTL